MTELPDPGRAASDEPPTNPEPPPTGAPAAEAPAVPGPEASPPGWVAAQPARRRTGLLVVAGCAAVVLVLVPAVLVGLIFLGGQISSILRGTVVFGSSASGCTVSRPATTFPVGTPVAYAAQLERQANAGETVSIAISFNGSLADSADQKLERAASCLTGTLPATLLGAGRYRLEFKSGTELLSSGEFDLTP